MLAAALWTLRQRRYQPLAALMLVVALGCIGAGTFEIMRFVAKVHENALLTANAHAAAQPLDTGLVPLAGHGPAPSRYAIRYRTVTANGSYLGRTELVRNQTLNDANGFYVLSPLRTADGVLLVVRGFVTDSTAATHAAASHPVPSGPVHVTGRLQTADTNPDDAAALGNGQLESINPAEQASRLGSGVFDAYLTLDPGQPGGAGLTALPTPDLTNPAGGAYEWQHLAYVIQWYLFALLALAAPFALSRHEAREAARRFGVDPDVAPVPVAAGPERVQLDGSTVDGGTPDGANLALREPGTLARRDMLIAREARAQRLADRYGLSLRPPPVGRVGAHAGAELDVSSLAGEPPAHEADAYRAAYNDQLWLLALSDGETPDVGPRPRRDELDGTQRPRPAGGDQIPRSNTD